MPSRPVKKNPILTFFAQGRCFLVDANWKCQPGRFYRPINKHARLYSTYIAPSGTASLTGTEPALNKVQPSLLSSTGSSRLPRARLHQVLKDPGSLPVKHPGEWGVALGTERKISPSQLRVWDAAYSNSHSSVPSANGNKNRRRSQRSSAAHRGSNFLLIPLTHHFISRCLGSGYLYLSQKTVAVIKCILLLFLLENFIMRFLLSVLQQ